MNDLVPNGPPPEGADGLTVGQEILLLLRALARNASAQVPPQPIPQRSPTIRTIFDWYEAQIPASRPPNTVKEEKRIRQLFCAFRPPTERLPWGQRTVDSFKPYHLKEFLDREAGGMANWTRKRWLSAIHTSMAAAARMGLIEKNPFHGLRLPQGRQGRDWTQGEYQAVLREATPLFRRLLVFLRFSGARPGEARKAKWQHLDLATRCITLKEHKTAHVVEAPRVIHLNNVCIKLLLHIKRQQPADQPFIFVNRYGNPWTMRVVVQQLAEIRDRLNLPADLKLHGLRHAFATNALMNDVEITTVASLLGHTSVCTTMRYAHLANKGPHLRAAAEQAAKPTARMRPTQLCQEAALWAFARKPELREANAIELHAYLLKTGWGPWLPANPRTFSQYLTPSRQDKGTHPEPEGGAA